MNTLLFVIESGSEWLPEGWIESQDGRKLPNDQMVLERKGSWISFFHHEDAFSEFSDDEKGLLAHLANPVAYLVEWNEDELVDEFLRAIPSGCDAMIDNDHGLMISVDGVRGRPVSSWKNSPRSPS